MNSQSEHANVNGSTSTLGEPPIRVLFVGSFLDKSIKQERGGQHVACETLVNSPIRERVDFIRFDTTNSRIPPPPLWQRLLQSPFRLLAFTSGLVSHKAHVVLLFTSGGGSFLEKSVMALAARVCGKPVVVSVRSGAFRDLFRRSPGYRTLVKLSLRLHSMVLCQSESWAQFFVTECGVPSTRVVVVPNWIDLERFTSHAPRARVDDDGVVRLLFVGWVDRKKGIFELLDAVREIDGLYRVTLDVVGEGADYGAAVSIVSGDPVLRNLVRFHGWLSGQDLVKRYSQAEVFVLPTYAEGFPNAVLEAMAMALPIITTPVGGIPDVLKSNRNGLLVAPRSRAEVMQAIRFMVENQDARVRFGSTNRQQVVRDHDITVLWPRLYSLLKGLM